MTLEDLKEEKFNQERQVEYDGVTTYKESRFTGPTELCPHPEWWHSFDEDSTETEVSEFLYGLVRALQPEFCIETGSAFGQTTRLIGEALRKNKHGRLMSFEIDLERYKIASSAVQGLPVTVVRLEAAQAQLDEGQIVDFAFLDSSYSARPGELVHFAKWFRTGTIVAVHDTAPEHGKPKFENGQDLHFQLNNLPLCFNEINLPTPRGLMLIEMSEE